MLRMRGQWMWPQMTPSAPRRRASAASACSYRSTTSAANLDCAATACRTGFKLPDFFRQLPPNYLVIIMAGAQTSHNITVEEQSEEVLSRADTRYRAQQVNPSSSLASFFLEYCAAQEVGTLQWMWAARDQYGSLNRRLTALIRMLRLTKMS